MTSVDSGVETSNESNDSCVAHDTRSLEISPIKISPSRTQVGVYMTNICSLNTASASSTSGIVDSSKEKTRNLILPDQKNAGTQVDIYMTNICSLNTASASSTSGIVDCSKEKTLNLILPDQKAPLLEIEPPAGLSFCNLQPACGFGKSYEILEEDFSSFRPIRSRHSRATPRRIYRRWSCKGIFHFVDEHKLRYAASTNNVDQVADLLHSGVNPNCRDHQRRTPLHLAACRGYSSVVRLLLEYGANPNGRDALANTPLHLAACTNHVEVVTLLLKAGTDINSSDYYGRNPLQLAQSKLKLLQRGSYNEDSLKIKEEVQKVIEMMLTFLHKKGQDSEAELLNAFQTRLTISQTKEEVETGVRDLLASLDNLNLNKSDA